ncbi:ABC-type multidrug transport system fused ATPase/permease subunit [Methanocalculus sp. AMF5]|uniref:ABC transporter ATP-binding protein n=1 Tax=Methanocalculus sp. AMF5 TaxID=1198257 RepID=UPI00209FD7B7|nr:ABC-type multidrug transport system fused ATPase/permease subunit [Methanocalculus sp. AMF5]
MSTIRNASSILYYLFGPFKKLLALYLLAVIVLAGLEVFRVSLVYPIINFGLDVDNQHRLLDTFFDLILPASVHPFLASALLLLLTTGVIAGFYAVVAYAGAYVFATVRDSLDRRIFARLIGNDYSYFAAKKQGDLLYIGQGAVTEGGQAIKSFMECIKNSLMALLYLLFILYLSFWLTVALLILGAVYAILIRQQLFTRVYRNSSILNAALMEKSVAYQEFISGIKTIFITGSHHFWADRYDAAVRKLKKAYTFVQALSKLPSIINDFLMFSIIALGAVVLYVSTGGDFLSYIGLFGTFMLALYRLVPAATKAQINLTSMVQFLPALEFIYAELSREDGERERRVKRGEGQPFSFTDSIRFQGVYFRYPAATRDTIRGVSFEIQKKTTVAIVGDSGSGKTTIANLLALLYTPDRGVIAVDGTDVHEYDPREYLRALGYIGQETFIYHDTIGENIRFGLHCTDEEIIAAAQRADAHSFIMATDHGYDTIIGDQGMKLSGGQRQRVAIARIILRNPEILLLDEATSSLDNISEKRIVDAIQQLSKNMTVITIAHRLSTIQNADVIYVLSEGRIVESGSHEELLGRRGEYYRLYLGQEREEKNEKNELSS